jgi:hypothetical protein
MELVALGYFIALRAGFFVIFCIFFEIKFLPAVATFELFSTFFQLDSSFVQMRVPAQDGLDVEQALYQLQNGGGRIKKFTGSTVLSGYEVNESCGGIQTEADHC